MALKQQHPTASAAPPEEPVWGRLAEKGETAPVVRFERSDGSVSFPLHALRRWELKPGPPECLAIAAGLETVTVTGQGLAALRNALDAGTLLIVRQRPRRGPAAAATETIVTGITFAVEPQ